MPIVEAIGVSAGGVNDDRVDGPNKVEMAMGRAVQHYTEYWTRTMGRPELVTEAKARNLILAERDRALEMHYGRERPTNPPRYEEKKP